MAKIDWKPEGEQNKPSEPTEIELLRAEIERFREEKKISDLALLELTEMILG